MRLVRLPFRIATWSRSLLLVLVVLAAGTFIRRGTLSGPDLDLCRAVARGDTASVGRALGNGAHLEVRCKEGETPLIAASHFGRREVIELLLTRGANVNAVTAPPGSFPPDSAIPGWTALHWSVHNRDYGTAEVLLTHGADVNSHSRGPGDRPLRLAEENGDNRMILLLRKFGAD
jgi:uncharacterized protein